MGSTSYISPFLIFLSLCLLLSLPIYFCFSVFPYPIIIQTSCLFFILSLLWLYHSVITILLYLVLLAFTVSLFSLSISSFLCVSLCLQFLLSFFCSVFSLSSSYPCLLSFMFVVFGLMSPSLFNLSFWSTYNPHCFFTLFFYCIVSFILFDLTLCFFLYVFYNCFVYSFFHFSVFLTFTSLVLFCLKVFLQNFLVFQLLTFFSLF